MYLFQKTSQLAIYESLPTLIKTVAPVKLQEYFSRGFLLPFKSVNNDQDDKLQLSVDIEGQVAALQGLCAGLRVHDPPQTVTMVLYQALEEVFQVVNDQATVSQINVCRQ